MKIRGAAMVESLETMKELEFWISFFSTWFSRSPWVPEYDLKVLSSKFKKSEQNLLFTLISICLIWWLSRGYEIARRGSLENNWATLRPFLESLGEELSDDPTYVSVAATVGRWHPILCVNLGRSERYVSKNPICQTSLRGYHWEYDCTSYLKKLSFTIFSTGHSA